MIKIKNMEKTYHKGKENELKVLDDISFTVEDGELVAIVGKSGAGKSTLLHIIACIDYCDEGEYYIDELLIKDLSEKRLAEIRNEKIGLVMQDYALVDDFTALENVMLPLDFAKKKRKEKKKKALEALAMVDMEERAGQLAGKMSGGQKQRVAIARAIVNDPSVILADEPTGALDSENSDIVMDIFRRLNDMGKTILIVTHDKELADQCKRTIEIKDGKLSY